MSLKEHLVAKRLFDIFLSCFALLLFGWVIVIGWILASLSTKSNGFFLQDRVGNKAKKFKIIKLKTMITDKTGQRSSVTAVSFSQITNMGKFLRKLKIDELPQLINVLLGHMSFVGPRPDVPGYADKLSGENRLILNLRPGITGPASLKYRNEDDILRLQSNPEQYNNEVIWPDKVKINLEYYRNNSLIGDVKIILKTLFG